MEEIGEECGVCAVYLKDTKESSIEVPVILTQMLGMLQHRGQRSAGISVYNPRKDDEARRKTIVAFKGVGKVNEVFQLSNENEREKIIERCRGIAGIGHTRYSTSGKKEEYFHALDEAQPFVRNHPRVWKRFAFAFNGNIANYTALRDEMELGGYSFETNVDTEVIMNLMSMYLKQFAKEELGYNKPDLFYVTERILNRMDGSCNGLFLFGDGELLAFRDSKGFHPLCYGENNDFYAIASESVALERIGIKEIKEVEPGEVLLFNNKGLIKRKIIIDGCSFCQFELVYFMKASSKFGKYTVKEIRQNLGIELANFEPLKGRLNQDFIVVPAPKTAITAAESYAETLNLRLRNAIEKNEDVRGFINPVEERKRIMNSTYMIHPDVKDKKVIIIDDSLVRGETSKILINAIKQAGASEVHIRLTEPPIKYPCFYGIDFPSQKELVASRHAKIVGEDIDRLSKSIGDEIGADSVIFQTIDGLIKALGIGGDKLCLACLTGRYPTKIGQKRFDELKEGP